MVHLSLEAKQQLSALRFIPLILGSRLPRGSGSLPRNGKSHSELSIASSCVPSHRLPVDMSGDILLF